MSISFESSMSELGSRNLDNTAMQHDEDFSAEEAAEV